MLPYKYKLMLKKVLILFLGLLTLNSCIKKEETTIMLSNIFLYSTDGLHPFNSNSSIRSFIFQYTQKTLIKLDHESLEYIPFLVESIYEISQDGLRYTFLIKEGVKWDDGSPFTVKMLILVSKQCFVH